ncbi:UDP-N-acetylglucosamine 2-epimerase (non-hydrolyzing) [Spirosoma sp. LMG 31448]|uniref:UDP-N-acetylglucosamine 2-epimerase (Non-hydrolyzing) n=1 Tax=Spirosoma utsteinense TaxID=2585773 RepID=A0ABR6W7Q2_9BACT|nr:UDP-N-acetylglucosamine 2-epimerase (non-hydrolyzing) [Spirosoma utsteinense]MBC3786085.1 UDP-N-acetylglucosamine 2-epimerase (non-hydrolyzing) [Spirosoma utsteinense]MBC3792274.1 UDP-N-acetylglucosamine 2-epimerase (non-hydrolyzing) [Spirosoma utsteinense]
MTHSFVHLSSFVPVVKILNIVGARPNFIKVAPLHRAFLTYPAIQSKIVHTGQHADSRMSDVFFKQLALPQPDYSLGPGPASPCTQTQQTARILVEFEAVLMAEQPDWVVVVGDVTSTLACGLAAAQGGIRVAHVEAGLRSGDRRMPEEMNRILTDTLSDLLFVTESAGLDNLRREGIPDEKVWFVGNVMIDSLVRYRPQANELDTVGRLSLIPGEYILVTTHRPANVDHEAGLVNMVQIVEAASAHKMVVFPVHPRTQANLVRFGLMSRLMAIPTVRVLEPQGYLEFLNLMEHAAVVITDSGGVQEETTFLQVPCLTVRASTERPVTVDLGTNQLLADLNPATVRYHIGEILAGRIKAAAIPPLWDGRAAGRIADILLNERTPVCSRQGFRPA